MSLPLSSIATDGSSAIPHSPWAAHDPLLAPGTITTDYETLPDISGNGRTLLATDPVGISAAYPVNGGTQVLPLPTGLARMQHTEAITTSGSITFAVWGYYGGAPGNKRAIANFLLEDGAGGLFTDGLRIALVSADNELVLDDGSGTVGDSPEVPWPASGDQGYIQLVRYNAATGLWRWIILYNSAGDGVTFVVLSDEEWAAPAPPTEYDGIITPFPEGSTRGGDAFWLEALSDSQIGDVLTWIGYRFSTTAGATVAAAYHVPPASEQVAVDGLLTGFAVCPLDWSIWEESTDASEADPIPGLVVPGSATQLRTVMTGTPTGTSVLEIETVRGGFPGANAGFLWRAQTDPVSPWLGWEAENVFRAPELFRTVPTSSGESITHMHAIQRADGMVVHAFESVDLTAYTREAFVYVEQADGSFIGTWSQSYTVGDATKNNPRRRLLPRLVLLPDGTIELYHCTYPRGWGQEGQGASLRKLVSRDGGETFVEASANVYPGSMHDELDFLAIAYGSGQHMMVLGDVGGAVFGIFGSDDGGHSFEEVFYDGDTGSPGGSYYDLLHTAAGFVHPGGVAPDAFTVFTGDAESEHLSLVQAEDGRVWKVQGSGSTDISVSSDHGRTFVEVNAAPSSHIVHEDYSAMCVTRSRAGFRYFAATAGEGAVHWTWLGGGYIGLTAPVAQDGYQKGWSHWYLPFEDKLPEDSIAVASHTGTPTVAAGGSPPTLQVSGPGSGTTYALWEIEPTSCGDWLTELDVVDGGDGYIDLTASSYDFRALIRVDWDADTIDVYDTALSEVQLGSSITPIPTEPFAIRLAVRAYAGAGDYTTPVAYAAAWYRLLSETEWTEIVSDESLTSGGTYDDKAELIIGSLDTDAFDVSISGWRVAVGDFLGISQGLAEGQAAPNPRPWSSRPLYLTEGQSIQATGYTQPGDAWTSTPTADYRVEHLLPALAPSPRQVWRSLADGDDHEIGLRRSEGHEVARSAHVLFLDGCTMSSVGVYAWISGAWELYGTVDLTYSIEAQVIGRHVMVGTGTGGDGLLPFVVQDALVGCTFVDSADAHFRVEANTEGTLADGIYANRVVLELEGEPVAGAYTGTLLLRRACALLHHIPEDEIEGWQLRFVAHAGQTDMECGTAYLAPLTVLPEGPDQTRTRVWDIREEIIEEPDGITHAVRTAPDGERFDLQFARIFPMYGASPNTLDYIKVQDSEDAGVAATVWTTPQVLQGVLSAAGRRPMVYLPGIPVEAGTPRSLQQLDALTAGGAELVRFASESVRHEAVTGHAGSACEVVRMSSVSLRRVD